MKKGDVLFYFGAAALAIFVFALRWVLYSQSHFIADDAYITYRYAENWVAGRGLVYNLGEKVLGTTTPLLTFLISAAVWLGIPAKLFSPVLNMGCDAVTALFILFLFRRHFGRTGFGFLAGFLYAVFPSPLVWSTSGMEASLYTLCLVASLVLFLSRRSGWSFFFLGCALLTRIDALVLLVALGLTAVVAREKLGWKPWLALVLVLAPWLIAASLYYGSPVPNSLVAKKVFYSQMEMFRSTPFEIINGFIFGGKSSLVSSVYSGLDSMLFLGLLLLAAAGTVKLLFGERRFWVLPLWAGGYVAFFIVGKTYMHPWYYAPFYAVYVSLAALGVMVLWDAVFGWLRDWSFSAVLKKGIVAAAVVAGVFGVRFETKILGHWLGEYQKTENFLTGIAYWLKDHSKDRDKIYYSDIGKLGYFSGRYILDSVGIVSPVVTRYYRAGDWLGPIREVKPEWVLFCETDFRLPRFLADPELKKQYAEVNRFDYKKSDQYSSAVYSASASGVIFPEIIVYQKQS